MYLDRSCSISVVLGGSFFNCYYNFRTAFEVSSYWGSYYLPCALRLANLHPAWP